MSGAPSICSTPGCPEEVEKSGYCPSCRSAREGARRKIDYGPKWRFQRASYLKRHPQCERCGVAKATDVHHIDERGGEEGSNRDDNLEALCKSCHSKQTLQPYKDRDKMRTNYEPPKGPGSQEPVVGGGLLEQMLRRKRTEADSPDVPLDDDGWPDVAQAGG